jgi:exodeoxyribonuclease III
VLRAHHPDEDRLYTWWAPWRDMRGKNIGWRLDFVLMSEALAAGCKSVEVRKDVLGSDHAPVVAVFDVALE